MSHRPHHRPDHRDVGDPEPPATDEVGIPLSDDELDAALDAGDTAFAESLAHMLRPPADLQRRTTSVVRDGLLARSTVDTSVGLLAVGLQALQLVFATPLSSDPHQQQEPR